MLAKRAKFDGGKDLSLNQTNETLLSTAIPTSISESGGNYIVRLSRTNSSI